jgi:hypothetical protein
VSLSSTPSGQGYWIFTSAGRVITKGDATNLGDMAGKHLNASVVSSTVAPDGSGYWMVAADGGVFSFGTPFWGSTGNLKLNKPVEGIVPTATNKGYWLVASDGGVFAFGDAGFKGSMGSTKLNKPVVGLVRYGDGYLMVASDGGIFDFSNLAFQGSLGNHPPANPIVGTAPLPGAAAGTPGGPGGTTNTTAPAVTTTTALPGGTAMPFSSTAIATWQTPLDPNRLNSSGVPDYAQEVDAVAQFGNRVFIGGQFTNLLDANGTAANPPIAYLAELDATTGAPIPGSTWTANAAPSGGNVSPSLPRGTGYVHALAVSPDGKRLYVGGEFTKIGGQQMPRLAALDINTGKLDPTFSPPTPSAYVNAVLPANGHVYIGGAWKTLAGVAEPDVAALHDTDGSLDPTFVGPQDFGGVFTSHTGARTEDPCYAAGTTPCPSGLPAYTAVVDSLGVTADGATLMAGGNFLHYGKAPGDPAWDYKNHAGLVALDAHTGAMTTWQPFSSRPGFAMATSPVDPTGVYVAAGGGGGALLKYVVGNASGKPVWKTTVDGDATGIAVTAARVYLVGHYDHICQGDALTPNTGGTGLNCAQDGPVHRHLAAFDHGGVLDSTFNGQANTPEGPDAVAIGPAGLYVGGNFTKVMDQNGARNQGGFALFPVH